MKNRIDRYNLGLIYPRTVGFGLVIVFFAVMPFFTHGRTLSIFKSDFFSDHPLQSLIIGFGWIVILLIGLLPLTYVRVLFISKNNKKVLYGSSVLYFINNTKEYNLNNFDKVVIGNSKNEFNTEGSFIYSANNSYSTKEINLYLKANTDKNGTLKIQNIGSIKKAERIFKQLNDNISQDNF